MAAIVPELLEKYCEKHSAVEGPVFKALAKETHARTARPQMQVGHLEGAFLRLLAKLAGAKRILEIGTFTGYSALAMAEALPPGGSLVTCDIDTEATAIARRYWGKSPAGRKIDLRLGPALKTLAGLRGAFDLVFIDADKTSYGRYWEACVPKVRKGGLLVADNVLWSGRVLDPRTEDDRAIVAFNERVRKDGRVEAVMLPVRDGMCLARKR